MDRRNVNANIIAKNTSRGCVLYVINFSCKKCKYMTHGPVVGAALLKLLHISLSKPFHVVLSGKSLLSAWILEKLCLNFNKMISFCHSQVICLPFNLACKGSLMSYLTDYAELKKKNLYKFSIHSKFNLLYLWSGHLAIYFKNNMAVV